MILVSNYSSANVVDFPDMNEREKYQKENGYTQIANQILDEIICAPFSNCERQIVLCIVRKTYGFNKKSDAISRTQLAKMTGQNEQVISRNLSKLLAAKVLVRVGQRGPISYNKYSQDWAENYRPSVTKSTHSECDQIDTLNQRVLPNRHTECDQIDTQQKTGKDSIGSTDVLPGDFAKSPRTAAIKKNPKKPPPEKPPKRDPVPYQKIVDLYHEILPMLPTVQKLTNSRKGYISARWREGDLPDLETWRDFFADVAQSKFLTGRTEGQNGRPPFIADLEWLTRLTNFVKIWEGRYHRG